MSDIPIQIVDENDEPLGVASMDEAQSQGLIHRMARIMVEDGEGRVLLQKRQHDRKVFPNRWDNSAAGHVDAGESYDLAARRELQEEIGLANVELEKLGYYRSSGSYEERKLNRFNRIYRVVVAPNTSFNLQTEEVATIQWMTVDEVKQLIANDPNQVTDGVIEVFKRFY